MNDFQTLKNIFQYVSPLKKVQTFPTPKFAERNIGVIVKETGSPITKKNFESVNFIRSQIADYYRNKGYNNSSKQAVAVASALFSILGENSNHMINQLTDSLKFDVMAKSIKNLLVIKGRRK